MTPSSYAAGDGRDRGLTHVLLLGSGWEPLQSLLAAASDTGRLRLHGPEMAYDATADQYSPGPAVLLISPEAWQPAPPRQDDAAPYVLRCITNDELDTPDLYADSDDFVTLPCPPSELVKRIQRLAQRHGADHARDAEAHANLIRVGGIALNPTTYQVSANGKPVDLAWLEFQLLRFLMENVGKVFTRSQLLANVWGVANIGGTRTVDVHIRRLRYKLETGNVAYFRTVKNVGYGMMEP